MPLLFRPDVIIDTALGAVLRNGITYTLESVCLQDLAAWKEARGLVATGSIPGNWPPVIIYEPAGRAGPGKETGTDER